MECRRILAVLVLLVAPAAAQTPPIPPAPPPAPPPPAPAPPPQAAPAPPRETSAPMPDPLIAPELQNSSVRAPTLATLVQQSAWQDSIATAAQAQFKQLPGNCAAAQFKPTGELTVYDPAQFDKGVLISGIWSERVAVTGCGTPLSLNILTVLQPGSPPARIMTMPGDTHADPATQKTALQYAQAVAARAAPPGCKQEMFTNTKFDGYTGLPNGDIRDRPNRAWREIWSLSSCGVPYSMELTFTPNAKGTQLSATNPVKLH